MSERFNEEAQQVVVKAKEQARQLKHNYISTEHLLLGLTLSKEGIAREVLDRLDIDHELVFKQTVQIVGIGEEVTEEPHPLTPRAKRVLELAGDEARLSGDEYIGPEHILLGIVRDNEGVAARILRDADADSETIRSAVATKLSQRAQVRRNPLASETVVTVWSERVDVDPPITIYRFEMRSEDGGTWPETFGSVGHLKAFLTGLTVGFTRVKIFANFSWDIPRTFGEPSGIRWTIPRNGGFPKEEKLDSGGNVIEI